MLAAASASRSWSLPLAVIARIWRAGCIIRSAFLDDIAAVYANGNELESLAAAPFFAALIKQNHDGLRRVVSAAALAGIPVPALSAALAGFDSMRTARSTADLIQSQRDYFGAHGFERTDRPGVVSHGPWFREKDS